MLTAETLLKAHTQDCDMLLGVQQFPKTQTLYMLMKSATRQSQDPCNIFIENVGVAQTDRS